MKSWLLILIFALSRLGAHDATGESSDHARLRPLTGVEPGNLAIVSVEGGQAQALADSVVDGAKGYPDFAWSPDRSRVAYATPWGQIEVASTEGGPQQILTDRDADHSDPSWAPDGETIAFSLGQSQKWNIWTIPASGGEPNQVTLGSGRDHSPAFSPDGKTIAFASWRSGNPDIWTVPTSGGQPTQLTQNPDFRWGPEGKGILVGSPVWLPNGEEVAFVRSDQRGFGVREVWVIPATGGTPRKLFADPAGDVSTPSFSPDGTQIAYQSDGSVYVASLDDGVRRLLAIDASSPAFSPDGTHVVFYQRATWAADVRNVEESSSGP